MDGRTSVGDTAKSPGRTAVSRLAGVAVGAGVAWGVGRSAVTAGSEGGAAGCVVDVLLVVDDVEQVDDVEELEGDEGLLLATAAGGAGCAAWATGG